MPSQDQPIRVLHYLNQWTAQGGIETFLLNIFSSADPSQIQFDMLVPEPGNKSNELDELLASFHVRKILCPNYCRHVSFAADFKRVIDQYGPYDIVHAHNNHVGAPVLRYAQGLGIKHLVAHAHNDHRSTYAQSGLLKKFYIRKLRRWIARYATHGLAASDNAGRSVYQDSWGNDPRWRLHHYGIELDRFAGPFDRNAMRAELGIPEDAYVVGHVGRFFDQKNHPYLMKIAGELIKRAPDAYVLLIGEGPGRAAAEREAQAMGIADNVIFAGQRQDVPALMAGTMDAFVLPSLFEGFGIVLIESQASGLPYVATDVIPQEADIIAGFGRRRKLTDAPAAWAHDILAWREKKPPMDQPSALAELRGGVFDSATSADRLFAFYREICDQSTS